MAKERDDGTHQNLSKEGVQKEMLWKGVVAGMIGGLDTALFVAPMRLVCRWQG